MSGPNDFEVLNFDKPDEMKAAVEQLKRSLPMMVEHARIVAQMRWASFQAHLDQGFTPEQALELCKTLTI